MTIDDGAAWLEREIQSRPLTVLVFFRGSWCPFCQAYLRELNGTFLAQVRERGGELIGITSHSDAGIAGLGDKLGLDYRVLSEPQNALARKLGAAITPKAETVLKDDAREYPEGMAQPAVVALDRAGKVLFQWAIDPSTMNLGGASDRPLPADIWPVIAAALDGKQQQLGGSTRLDPDYLAAHYPEQHATFQAWVASMSK